MWFHLISHRNAKKEPWSSKQHPVLWTQSHLYLPAISAIILLQFFSLPQKKKTSQTPGTVRTEKSIQEKGILCPRNQTMLSSAAAWSPEDLDTQVTHFPHQKPYEPIWERDQANAEALLTVTLATERSRIFGEGYKEGMDSQLWDIPAGWKPDQMIKDGSRRRPASAVEGQGRRWKLYERQFRGQGLSHSHWHRGWDILHCFIFISIFMFQKKGLGIQAGAVLSWEPSFSFSISAVSQMNGPKGILGRWFPWWTLLGPLWGSRCTVLPPWDVALSAGPGASRPRPPSCGAFRWTYPAVSLPHSGASWALESDPRRQSESENHRIA